MRDVCDAPCCYNLTAAGLSCCQSRLFQLSRFHQLVFTVVSAETFDLYRTCLSCVPPLLCSHFSRICGNLRIESHAGWGGSCPATLMWPKTSRDHKGQRSWPENVWGLISRQLWFELNICSKVVEFWMDTWQMTSRDPEIFEALHLDNRRRLVDYL